MVLLRLDGASPLAALGPAKYGLHPLRGDRRGLWAVKVAGNWRMTFRIEGEDAYDVDLTDYRWKGGNVIFGMPEDAALKARVPHPGEVLKSLLQKSLGHDPPREIASEAPFCDSSGPSGVVLRSFQGRFTVAEDFFNRLLRSAIWTPTPPAAIRA